jgi:hypothetical protein
MCKTPLRRSKRLLTLDERTAIVEMGIRRIPLRQIARHMFCSVPGVKYILKKNRIPWNKRISSSPDKAQAEQLAQFHRNGKSLRWIQSETSFSLKTIKKVLRAKGLTIAKPGFPAKYRSNHSAFDVLTNVTAYFVGVMIADGGLCSGWEFKLELHPKDKEILHRFKTFLQTEAPLHERYKNGKLKSLTLRITSKRNWLALEALGVTPKKSATAKVHSALAFNVDFWRGALDGDGSVAFDRRHHYPSIRMVGSQPLMAQFADFCASVIGISPNLNLCKRSPSVRVVSIYGNYAKRLAQYLLQSKISCLLRKQNILEQMPEWESSTIKLNPEKAAAIRGSDESTHTLAVRYGVSEVTIRRIRKGQTWNV